MYMIHWHFGAHAPTGNIIAFLGQTNGCGPTRPIHLKLGLYRHSKSWLNVSSVPIRRHFNYHLLKVHLFHCSIISFSCIYLLYASTRIMFYFVLHHSRHFSVTLRHHCLTILLTVRYRYLSSLRLLSFVPFFVTDLFRPYYVPSTSGKTSPDNYQ